MIRGQHPRVLPGLRRSKRVRRCVLHSNIWCDSFILHDCVVYGSARECCFEIFIQMRMSVCLCVFVCVCVYVCVCVFVCVCVRLLPGLRRSRRVRRCDIHSNVWYDSFIWHDSVIRHDSFRRSKRFQRWDLHSNSWQLIQMYNIPHS